MVLTLATLDNNEKEIRDEVGVHRKPIFFFFN